jgi:hypothetical protein
VVSFLRTLSGKWYQWILCSARQVAALELGLPSTIAKMKRETRGRRPKNVRNRREWGGVITAQNPPSC